MHAHLNTRQLRRQQLPSAAEQTPHERFNDGAPMKLFSRPQENTSQHSVQDTAPTFTIKGSRQRFNGRLSAYRLCCNLTGVPA